MKNVMIFLGGLVTGVLMTILFAEVASSPDSTTADVEDTLAANGVVLFDEPSDMIITQPLTIIQALSKGVALAKVYEGEYAYDGLVVLLISEDDYYYDDQKIKLPKGKCFRQVGVHTYETNLGLDKTVPVVREFDK